MYVFPFIISFNQKRKNETLVFLKQRKKQLERESERGKMNEDVSSKAWTWIRDLECVDVTGIFLTWKIGFFSDKNFRAIFDGFHIWIVIKRKIY